jgi:hypothetical protein
VGEAKRVYQNRHGVRRTTIVDEDNPDRLVVHTEQALDEIIDGIARDRETMRHGVNKVAARLPLFVYEDLVHRGIADDEDALKKWLNGPEARPWRIWQGEL